MVSVLRALLALCLPTALVRPLLNLLGWRLAAGARIGLAWVQAERLHMAPGARIGHLNLVRLRRVAMREGAYLGRGNLLSGPLSLRMAEQAGIGNRNRVLRAARGVVSGPSVLRMGRLSKITADHRLDCTCSVALGHYSTMAGAQTQLWTHGYVHGEQGHDRYRIDGQVIIEDNVYIGSACLISMGVRIGRGVIVGGGTAVSKSLPGPGMYVSSPVRALARPADPDTRPDLERLVDPGLVEAVYRKRRP